MALSIKGGGGIINEVPKVSDLKVTAFETETIDIEYRVEDVELTICRHYLLLNGAKTEITKQVGYESSTNVFKYKITGLKMNTPYTIQIAASDGHDEGLSEAIQQTTKNMTIYGVRVDESNSNPESCCTYIEDAVGIQVANSTSLGGWSNISPFNKIKLVGFKNGEETGDINPNDKTKYLNGQSVPGDVDVMSRIPKIYWDFKSISNGYELRISESKFNDTCDCYAHKVGGVEKDYIYIGAYLGYNQNGKLRSISGVRPTTKASLLQFRQYAQVNGEGYQQFNWFTLILLQNLYIISYKNLNSQEALGYGYANANSTSETNIANTGGTNSKGMIFGETTGKQQICFLGIEDFYGNLSQSLDGMHHSSSFEVTVTPDNKNFSDINKFKNIGKFVNKTISGEISKVAHTNEGGYFPKEHRGSGTTYYCDHSDTYTDYYGQFGGAWFNKQSVGAFFLGVNWDESSSTITYIGSRLVYLG